MKDLAKPSADPRELAKQQIPEIINILMTVGRGDNPKNSNGSEYEMTPVRLKSLETILNKGLPNLQAVEHKTGTDYSKFTGKDLEAALKGLIRSHPGLLKILNLEKSVAGKVVSTQRPQPKPTIDVTDIEALL